MIELSNDYDAFVAALMLALTAPTDEKSDQAIALAESFQMNLTEEQSAAAKAHCEARYNAWSDAV